MFYQLPPVGNPINLSSAGSDDMLLQLTDSRYQPHYYASGTAALAAAIIAAIKLKNVGRPEVILPAYGCPDLISAAVFAGAQPVLVDLEADCPWMNLAQLAEKTSEQTVAIIGVNLFGISERLSQLRILAERVGAVLIEDSAQAFPGSSGVCVWQGDLVILSFGRGKPVSLLGGGAVLCNKEKASYSELTRLMPEGEMRARSNMLAPVQFWLKAKLYNGMINPRLYWLPQSLPFLHLGETRYHPLSEIASMDKERLSRLATNIKAYQSNTVGVQNKLREILAQCDLDKYGITDLPHLCKIPEQQRLLRYPLLVRRDARDELYEKLSRIGLGVSRMYPAILPEIDGLEMLKQQCNFSEAKSFAERLLTLPTHAQVKQRDIDHIGMIISG
ncbi:MAG: DegT/DnrJ/EryC1/StrS family aminotransferase [Gammaproteobacteria bacterium]|nr:DegT/DnrJ/EryC1/StrS family aminotransferase [Gammaproteobacteria bacterium]